MKRPRFLLCAPSSGAGKTTAACAILQALTDLGKRPAAFKSGPDYIDPMFHREVIGAYSANLDLFLMGEEAVRAGLCEARGMVALIEGAMGYYDGVSVSGESSAYDLACRTRTPAVLVLNAKGQALSAAAVAKGMLTFRPDSNIQGVILNRVPAMFYPRLKKSVEAETGLRVYGFLPERPDCSLESRHLGLVTAAEVGALREKLAVLSGLARQYIDLDGLLSLADIAPELQPPAPPAAITAARPRIAVARDRAFCFYYDGALRFLEELGAELAEFSPLRDRALPENSAGLYLGGGYPELYAEELSGNTQMRAAVKTAIQRGLPTIAECGGFLYLHRTLEDDKGRPFPMCGVIEADAHRTERLQRFGYITMTARAGGLLGPAGTTFPAHEFHYWESAGPGADFSARKPRSTRGWDCGHHGRTLYAGFPHFHLRAVPNIAQKFVRDCESYTAVNHGNLF